MFKKFKVPKKTSMASLEDSSEAPGVPLLSPRQPQLILRPAEVLGRHPGDLWDIGYSIHVYTFFQESSRIIRIFHQYIYIFITLLILILITTLWCRVWFVDEWWWMAMDIPGLSRISCSFMLCAVKFMVTTCDNQWTNHGVSIVSGGMIRRWGPWTGGEHLVSPIGAGWDSEISEDVITMAERNHATGK